jgi:hyperosmotically inducible protein
MLNKTIVIGVLSFASMSPFIVSAEPSTTMMANSGLSDAATTTQIKALFVASPLIKSYAITVVTNNHNVSLKGTLSTDMQYSEAVSLAQSVQGVTGVNADNLLVSASKAPLTDTYITAKAKGTIMQERLFGTKSVEYWPVSIETKDGVVYLSGTVDTEEQRSNIVTLIEGLQGVKSVQSAITVK